MSFLKTWSSCFMDTLWSETNKKWEEEGEDWRAIGTNPFERRLVVEETRTEGDVLYIIEFTSTRLEIAYYTGEGKLALGKYVILEADRGDDCGLIVGYTNREAFDELVVRNKNLEEYFKLKKIYRVATEKDLRLLAERNEMVKSALAECKNHVKSKCLDMEIRDCEYQFDLNKITFFYKSDERIDFRELVKDLYKVFKTRIWMCSVDKLYDKLLLDITKRD